MAAAAERCRVMVVLACLSPGIAPVASLMSIFFSKIPGFIVLTNQPCILSVSDGYAKGPPLYT